MDIISGQLRIACMMSILEQLDIRPIFLSMIPFWLCELFARRLDLSVDASMSSQNDGHGTLWPL